MAEIKKIKVEGVEYDIGSNLGVELEWKLVASGEIEKEESDIILIKNLTIEPKKQYILRIYNNPNAVFDAYNLCLIEDTDYIYCNAMDVDENPAPATFIYHQYTKQLSLYCYDNSLFYDSGDEYELYELTIKNVVNPSNVVTPNKLNLYTTGTYYEKGTFNDTEIYYKLEKPLQPNKLYYVERYDVNMGMYYNCIIRTNNDAQIKCTTKMFACEDNEDTIIFVNVYITPGEGNTGQEFNISGEHSIYKGPEDTLEIYELPFEF